MKQELVCSRKTRIESAFSIRQLQKINVIWEKLKLHPTSLVHDEFLIENNLGSGWWIRCDECLFVFMYDEKKKTTAVNIDSYGLIWEGNYCPNCDKNHELFGEEPDKPKMLGE